MGVIDDIFAKEPEQRTVEFCTDRALREALSEAQQKLAEARERAYRVRSDRTQSEQASREVSDLEERVDELVDQVRGKLVRFTFAPLEPGDFDRLKGEHRPTERQLTRARKEKAPQPDWNEDTFPPVLVAAACIKVESPSGAVDGLSLDDVQRMWTSQAYNEAERNTLFNTALSAQLTRTRIDLPKGV